MIPFLEGLKRIRVPEFFTLDLVSSERHNTSFQFSNGCDHEKNTDAHPNVTNMNSWASTLLVFVVGAKSSGLLGDMIFPTDPFCDLKGRKTRIMARSGEGISSILRSRYWRTGFCALSDGGS